MKTIAFANQKGGVGKTTSTINIGAGLSLQGKKILLIDLDPQANLTYSLRLNSQRIDNSVYDVLKGRIQPDNAIITYDSFDILPSSNELAEAELEFAHNPEREKLLKKGLQKLSSTYDYILIDCPPSLGLLTINAFTAADEIFIVIQPEYLALHGLSNLTKAIDEVRDRQNPALSISGVICTLYDKRKNLNQNVLDHIKDYFREKVFDTIIRENVALAEAPSHHKSIFEYDSESNGAKDYLALSKEIIHLHK